MWRECHMLLCSERSEFENPNLDASMLMLHANWLKHRILVVLTTLIFHLMTRIRTLGLIMRTPQPCSTSTCIARCTPRHSFAATFARARFEIRFSRCCNVELSHSGVKVYHFFFLLHDFKSFLPLFVVWTHDGRLGWCYMVPTTTPQRWNHPTYRVPTRSKAVQRFVSASANNEGGPSEQAKDKVLIHHQKPQLSITIA